MATATRGRGEMADAQVLGTCGAIRKGSSPFVPTNSIIAHKNASTDNNGRGILCLLNLWVLESTNIEDPESYPAPYMRFIVAICLPKSLFQIALLFFDHDPF